MHVSILELINIFAILSVSKAVVKTEISTRRGSSRRQLIQPMDRRRLEASIPKAAHRGLRMLCANEILDIDCPVDTAEGEFACVRISDVRVDIGKIQDMIQPVLEKLVNPPEDDGLFDEVVIPLLFTDERIPGISDIAGVSNTTLT